MIQNYVYEGVKVIGGDDDVSYPGRLSGNLNVDLSLLDFTYTVSGPYSSGTERYVIYKYTDVTNKSKNISGHPTFHFDNYCQGTRTSISNMSLKDKYGINSIRLGVTPSAFTYTGTGTGIIIGNFDFKTMPAAGTVGYVSQIAGNTYIYFAIKITNGTMEGIKFFTGSNNARTYQEALAAYNAGSNNITITVGGSRYSDTNTAELGADEPSISITVFYPDPTPN